MVTLSAQDYTCAESTFMPTMLTTTEKEKEAGNPFYIKRKRRKTY
jgi:hypothetical protein